MNTNTRNRASAMNRLVAALIALSCFASVPALGQAQRPAGFPNKVVKIIVPYGPGGLADLLSRILAERLGTLWGQPLVVDNRPGGSGAIGIEMAIKSAPDGYTLVAIPVANLAVNPHLGAKLSYDVFKDITPVSLIASVHNVLVVSPALGVSNLKELIALAKAKPGALSFSSPGVSSQGHITGEMFNYLFGVSTLHVPYNGLNAAVKDVLGGQISFAFVQMPAALPLVQGDKLRGLGVSSAKRSALLPNVPTVAEAAGIPEFEAVSWSAIMAPAGTPEAIRNAIAADIHRVVFMPEIQERLKLLGAEPVGSTPQELARIMKEESDRYGAIIKKAKIRGE
jgi:tripartite-type tricarboxylate transporter receptor subunit TctC